MIMFYYSAYFVYYVSWCRERDTDWLSQKRSAITASFDNRKNRKLVRFREGPWSN